jgi:hypothetical protein
MVIAALAIIASVPLVSLTPAQRHELTQALVCPERLADDAARMANTDHFMSLYLRFAPHSKSGERMAMRERIFMKKRCRYDHPLQYTYPET